jgi:tetratricopeptide (TPR) repeat protein
MATLWLGLNGLGLSGCSPDRDEGITSSANRSANSVDAERLAPPPSSDEALLVAADSPDDVLNRTAELLDDGEAAHALWEAEEGLRRFPTSDGLRIRLAEIAILVGNPSLARDSVQHIEAGSPLRADAVLAIARAELALGDIEPALEALVRGQREFPSRSDIRLLRIAMLTRAKRTEEALEVIREAIDDFASDEDAQRRLPFEVALARAQAAEGDAEAAIDSLLSLVSEPRAMVQLWAALAQLLWREGRAEEAVVLLSDAIQSDPELESALSAVLASLNVSLGNHDEAEEILRKTIEKSARVEAYLALADLLVLRDQAGEVPTLLEEAIVEHPDDLMLRSMLVESLIGLERLEDADAQYRVARALDPKHHYLELLRARIDLAKGWPQRAAETLRALAPVLDRAETHYWLGRALEASGDFRGAERRYALALPRRTGWAAPHLALARLAERRGDWPAMAAHAGALVRTTPGGFEGWSILARALAEQEQRAKLNRVVETLSSRFPDRMDAHLAIARSLQRIGRIDEALEILVSAVEQFGPAPPLEAERALALGISGRVAAGIEVVQRSSIEHPDSTDLLWAGASLYFAAGDAERGRSQVDRALSVDPENPKPLRLRCEYAASIGDFESASADCGRYIEKRPDDPKAYFVLAVAEEGRGHAAAAIAAYRKAAVLDPHAFEPLNNLALLFADEGDLDAALDAAQRAYRLAPDNVGCIDTLADIYLRVGLTARAVAILEQARSITPDDTTLESRLVQARNTKTAATKLPIGLARCAA